MIQSLGDVPLAAINVGITAVIPAVNAQIGVMTSDLADLQPSVAAQLQLTVGPPVLPGPAAVTAAGDNLLAYAATLNPATWFSACTAMREDIAVELGLLSAQVQVVADAVTAVEAGISTGGIATWCYSGRAPSPLNGLLDAAACQEYLRPQVIDAVVVATDSDAAWATFAAGFNDAGLTDSSGPRLTFCGRASAGNLLLALAEAFDLAKQFQRELGARQLKLQADLQLALGLNLPNAPDIMLDVPFDLGSIAVNIDLDAMFGAVQFQIDAVADLLTDLQVQLSASSLACWRFHGPAGDLGTEVGRAVGARFAGDVKAAVMTFAEPSAYASFATVFAVG